MTSAKDCVYPYLNVLRVDRIAKSGTIPRFVRAFIKRVKAAFAMGQTM